MRKVISFLLIGLLSACSQNAGDPANEAISLLSQIPPEGFERATTVKTFSFPRDHGQHPEFRTEWWYLTGNLQAEERPFGYQLTLFRFGLEPRSENDDAIWASDSLWLGQLAISDLQQQQFHTAERFSRRVAGLTGAADDALDVQIEGWRLWQVAGESTYRISVNSDEMGLELSLEPKKPLVLQGNSGLSQKSSEKGNASYYYSHTRLATQGELKLGEQTFKVDGNSWFDREWSTSALAPKQDGWDWFALQLDDGHDLMFYQLRLENGEADPQSAGIWVDEAGSSQRILIDELELESQSTWLSNQTNIAYPSGWQLNIPKLDLSLLVTPIMAAQEWQGRFKYWEGAVRIEGTRHGVSVTGRGYVELTGY